MTVSVGVCGTMIEGYNEGWIDFGGVARSAASAGSHLKRFSRSSRARLMSAMGQKRTLFTVPFYVCFTPESGHLSACAAGRIYECTP
jgi:hypothetical protein